MSRTSRVMRCTPEDVFGVLADGWSYVSWVVGSARIRAVDERWPAEGTQIHHSVGLWPALINDTSQVENLSPPLRIQLKVRAWPTGEGRVTITCRPKGDSTLVTIEERAVSGPAVLIPAAVQDVLLNARNREALRRLSYLAEGHARPTWGHGG
jgi:hypothetical protein